MFKRRHPPLDMDPFVAPVEQFLSAIVAPSDAGGPLETPVISTHAVWLCACETSEDSSGWLIHAVGEHGIGWARLEDVHLESLEADHVTGCHPAPEAVLRWLKGEQRRPWRGPADFPDDSFIYDELRRRLDLAGSPPGSQQP